jgi:hypothetical protein
MAIANPWRGLKETTLVAATVLSKETTLLVLAFVFCQVF